MEFEHLSDLNTYLPLDGDYTKIVAEILTHTISQLKKDGLLSTIIQNSAYHPHTLDQLNYTF